ncbi:MAG: putative toxin-antitoxin system toxin component, PIN family [Deltaproteobacteria bacterium]|nr:putative toxin-antitoxin system toxin component, PIN family [Deltaproteobacteria bacterium]
MRIVLDTNVFVSGVFFSGPPHRILQAWRGGKVQLVVSQAVLEEYERVGRRLSHRFPRIDLDPFLKLLALHAEIVTPAPLPKQVCSDPDDDKFLSCALAGRCPVIVTGDRALLTVSGYRRLRIVKPRAFVDEYL